MPSFDIVNRVDMQHVDNAVNNSVREISQRYDFRGSHCEITLDKKEKKINFLAADKVKMDAMREIFIANVVRQDQPQIFQIWQRRADRRRRAETGG